MPKNDFFGSKLTSGNSEAADWVRDVENNREKLLLNFLAMWYFVVKQSSTNK